MRAQVAGLASSHLAYSDDAYSVARAAATKLMAERQRVEAAFRDTHAGEVSACTSSAFAVAIPLLMAQLALVEAADTETPSWRALAPALRDMDGPLGVLGAAAHAGGEGASEAASRVGREASVRVRRAAFIL